MIRMRIVSWMLGVATLVLLVPQRVVAIGPAFIVVHGGSVQDRMVLGPAIGRLTVMWGGGVRFYDQGQESRIPSGLEGRRYLDYDVFWGRFTSEELLHPELASQHGRLYLPTKDQAAAVVLTAPVMDGGPGATQAPPQPIPGRLDGYTYGRALTPSEANGLMAAGVALN